MNSGNMWTRENTRTLIEAYRIYECMWQTTSPFYRHKVKRKEAVETITRLLQNYRPEIKVEDVKKKINRIRLQFVSEINKLNSYKLYGETYKPTLWYFKQLKFLEPYIKIKQKPTKIHNQPTPTTSPRERENIPSSITQNDHGEEIENIVIKDEFSDPEIIEDSENEDDYQSLPKETYPTPKIENQHIISGSENNIISSTEAENRVLDLLSTGYSSTLTLVPTGKMTKRNTLDAIPALECYENNVTEEKKPKLEYLNNAVELSDDKISIFGKFIMSQLRTVTDKVLYMKLEHTIQNAIIETQLKQIQIDQVKNE